MFTLWRKPLTGIILPTFMAFSASTAKAEDKASYVMGALGDSITMAFNAGGPLDHPANSWSVGWSKNVDSHYERLLNIYDDVAAYNAARSGAKADELDTQISKLLKKATPDYVTILMGANDICSWPADHSKYLDQYNQNMTAGVERLIKANADIKIVLAPVPNMLQLWKVGRVNNCQGKWNLYNFCSPLLGEKRTDAERAAFVDRLNDLNGTIEQIANEHAENVRFAQSIATAPFEWKHISNLDCFHPSMAGQSFLADESWKDGWFAE